jgi:hypothetical protein
VATVHPTSGPKTLRAQGCRRVASRNLSLSGIRSPERPYGHTGCPLVPKPEADYLRAGEALSRASISDFAEAGACVPPVMICFTLITLP